MKAHWILSALFALGCGAGDGAAVETPASGTFENRLDLGTRYVEDPAFRRAELEASLVNPNNDYSKLRLERYSEDKWGALPEWNPLARTIDVGDTTAPPDALGPSFARLDLDSVPWEEAALVELGRRAFFGYPTQLATYLRAAIGDPAKASRYGLWTDGSSLGATMWTEVPAGTTESAVTCATCHASAERGTVVAGINNADLDVSSMIAAESGGAAGTWGPGRVDVTPDGIDNAAAIADLRSVRFQVALQRAATVRNGLIPLAIRIETLCITSLQEAFRPPRKIAFAMALYLWQLESVPIREPDTASEHGARIFGDDCASCHKPPGFSGPSVPIGLVGTDPAVGTSPDRTTGDYRVPSLRGVGDRKRLLANGAVFDIRELLASDRPAPGHSYGVDLDDDEKADLISYLETL
jgi:mono/diheme cytochrome c family protein